MRSGCRKMKEGFIQLLHNGKSMFNINSRALCVNVSVIFFSFLEICFNFQSAYTFDLKSLFPAGYILSMKKD